MPKLREAPGYPSTGTDGDTPTVDRVPTIPLEELIDDIDALLSRAEEGEEFTITVSGRPVGVLGPARKQWVDSSTLEDLWKLPVDENLARDIAEFDIELRDPWAERE